MNFPWTAMPRVQLPEVELFPGAQTNPRKEAIRRELMSDVARIKILGICCVVLALLLYLLTDSVAAFLVAAALGVVGLHFLAFSWANQYFATAAAERRERRAAREAAAVPPVEEEQAVGEGPHSGRRPVPREAATLRLRRACS